MGTKEDDAAALQEVRDILSAALAEALQGAAKAMHRGIATALGASLVVAREWAELTDPVSPDLSPLQRWTLLLGVVGHLVFNGDALLHLLDAWGDIRSLRRLGVDRRVINARLNGSAFMRRWLVYFLAGTVIAGEEANVVVGAGIGGTSAFGIGIVVFDILLGIVFVGLFVAAGGRGASWRGLLDAPKEGER